MATNARDSGAGSKAQSNGDTDSLASQLGLDRLAEEVRASERPWLTVVCPQ